MKKIFYPLISLFLTLSYAHGSPLFCREILKDTAQELDRLHFPPQEFIDWIPPKLFEDKDITPLSPLESLQFFLRHQRNLLSYFQNDRGTTVILRDFSALPFIRAHHDLDVHLFPIPEDTRQRFFWELDQALSTLPIPFLPSDNLLQKMTAQLQKSEIPQLVVPQQSLRDFLKKNRAIEIQIKNINQNDNITIIVAQSVSWLLSDLRREYANPIQFLKNLGVTIAVTSFDGRFLPFQELDLWSLPTPEPIGTGAALESRVYFLNDILSLKIPASASSLVRGSQHLQHPLDLSQFSSGD